MILDGVAGALMKTSAFHDAAGFANLTADFSVAEGVTVPLLTALLGKRRVPFLLVVAATAREAESIRSSFSSYMPTAEVLDFPAWETLPHERLSPSVETVGRRLGALRQISEWTRRRSADDSDATHPLVVVASVRAVLQPLADNLLEGKPLRLVNGARGYDLATLARELLGLAYARVDIVSRRGEFAVRGGIVDVFPPSAEHPVRIEFFGDEIENMRPFSVADQRSLPETMPETTLPPGRELLLGAHVRQKARILVDRFPGIGDMLTKISEGIPVDGMESLTPVLVDRLVPLTHYLPAGGAFAVLSPERVVTRAINLAETNKEFLEAAWSAATAGAQSPIDLAGGDFLTLDAFRDAATSAPGAVDERAAWWTFSSFIRDVATDEISSAETDDAGVQLDARSIPSFHGNVDGALEYVSERLRAGWSACVTARGNGTIERTRDVLADQEIAARIVDAFPVDPDPGVVYLVQADISVGFESEAARLLVLSEGEFYGRRTTIDSRRATALPTRRKNVVDPLQLQAGDFVVHETHGIGKFLELTQREVSTGGRNATKTTREYLVVEYAASKRGYPGDKLYVPTDQLDQLTRYVGGEAPALSKMGGGDWAAAKGKARKAVRDIAVELVKLYSARMASKGHAFSPDTPWQRELEEAFPFVETPDQLQTINEIKADMERAIPMDRLLSGDVGFGKTEVAVRAAFKAVQDSKQVAILVPTTLLVKQHMETFRERFAGFPVRIRPLSRFQSGKEVAETKKELADGSVDVVIGTHRILSESITFKDLGLVVIDEEQRFGVEHKDTLKKMKTNVDILSMSATPIPRTLEMAVTGIREMSTLATAPEERHPILTFVGPHSDRQVAAAIRREILREGQVFFVHNRVSSINRIAERVAELVPEARVAVAHGQLAEATLERVVVDFWERKYDVLVCTTIIETGLDIQNANTIIIDRADKYGLSQLHQLRGRVGRGRERAYAYFLYDPDIPLTETAYDRLSTIAANNELGSGMRVALKDLEIRGAGNLLGGEQAGHIAGVGFDLYLRMIGEAVSAFRDEKAEVPTELRLELPVEAHIPEDYIDSERLRLEAYQKLSSASGATAPEGHIDLVREEITDRYGELPVPVRYLIDVARLRQKAQKVGLSEVVTMGSNLRIAPARLPDSIEVRLMRLYSKAKYAKQASVVVVPLPTRDGQMVSNEELIAWVGTFLDDIFPGESAATSSA